ncbi:hypothetical protein AAFF_G00305020 [Aldrovandia affinis]|uniref:Uncharacterized protein n=1 Tax=Aldrovandia affinis TaxID=143900 RepID=A0AAD7WR22_9TELE|nr:hypothetical protein AAFF_G00305020 [Aldrovandia affinis]
MDRRPLSLSQNGNVPRLAHGSLMLRTQSWVMKGAHSTETRLKHYTLNFNSLAGFPHFSFAYVQHRQYHMAEFRMKANEKASLVDSGRLAERLTCGSQPSLARSLFLSAASHRGRRVASPLLC